MQRAMHTTMHASRHAHRFEVWPYLERFSLDVERELLAELGGSPDLVIGNYRWEAGECQQESGDDREGGWDRAASVGGRTGQ